MNAVPLFGMLTGLLISLGAIVAIIKVAQGPLGQALARRIHGPAVAGPDLAADVAMLQEQVDDLRRQVEDAHERLDFAERLLGQAGGQTRLSHEAKA